ncbi:MAG: DUF2892 domain-containing protein [Rhodobacteraceae bacterium]|nr:DUF2892 domain-containing protein [Paracoccaceae bacterium]
MKFNANLGSLDRGLRILFGMALFVMGYMGYIGSFGWVGILVGGILLLTAVFTFCPIYSLLRISTAPKSDASDE